jgi:hypothetical protein
LTLSKGRTAILTAVPVAAATVSLTVLAYIASVEGLPNGVALEGFFLYFSAAILIASLAGLFVGLPIVWLLRRFGLLNFPVVAAAGMLSGAAVSWLILSTFPPLIGAIAGLAAATTWWLIAGRTSEPDA